MHKIVDNFNLYKNNKMRPYQYFTKIHDLTFNSNDIDMYNK